MSWLDRILGGESRTLGRHSLMLGSLILLLVALPILQWPSGLNLHFPILFGLVLFAAIWINQTKRWLLWAALSIGVGAGAGNLIEVFSASGGVRIASDLIGLVLIAFSTFIILRSVVKEREVELDTVIGGVCAYLMIGLSFAVFYRLLVDTVPGAFLFAGEPLEPSIREATSLSTRLLYYSFVTLTTTGYGDITPSAGIAQMTSAGEAVVGQLYVAIFIARLMGLHIEAGRPRADCDDPPADRE